MNPKELASQAMKNPIEGKILNDLKDFATNLVSDKQKLTTSQLRKFFGQLKATQQKLITRKKEDKLSGEERSEVEMLKVYIAYSAGRDKNNSKIVEFYKFIDSAINHISTIEDFHKFVKVVEVVVAFHKVAESGITEITK